MKVLILLALFIICAFSEQSSSYSNDSSSYSNDSSSGTEDDNKYSVEFWVAIGCAIGITVVIIILILAITVLFIYKKMTNKSSEYDAIA
ncbi:hypothetical protein ENUP19_0317G0086 [Entamoeba nuttalli]|uniref:Uncharacterized protein n=2 Tax=Entamoeba nuttalli TaxID=412467 RepID=K2G5T5_ENTNP|nr:hypothetical protein ENU1_188570 [Entamoeba nuttalli P19]EKE37706.1 hypothetical protein ENU1_188570 [Entamoeba nuttalli P19]|eukprot:XP_008859952.1 hypothetical protein ENU1_188570 [Entamoeba nuttalli P19]